jgi:8-hydroxy-5-deazaflavin:NADPH oxidoreductase
MSPEAHMKVGILGSGGVAKALGEGFLRHGHEAMLGTRSPSKLSDWSARNPKGRVGGFSEAAAFGQVVVLAVKGLAAEAALRAAEPANLSGKTVIDTTNPIDESPPQNGVLKFFTTLDESLMERLQKEFPEARLVKAFNSVGSALMVDPDLPGGRPTMFICGNDEGAKGTVAEILDSFGWETADMGKAESARAIEPLCILWCIPGFLRNEWSHAFKLVRK